MVVPPTAAPSRATRELAEKISRLVSEHRSANSRMTDAEVDQALRQSMRVVHKEHSTLGVAPVCRHRARVRRRARSRRRGRAGAATGFEQPA